MAFLGGLGALAGLAQGYAEQQQRQQQQQTEMIRQRQAMMQLQEIQRQRQQQQNIAPILRGLAGSGALNLAPLAALPQGTGGGGGMPGGGMPNPSPGLAPGFSRDNGMLTRNGQPPDTMLPGGIPAWNSSGGSSLFAPMSADQAAATVPIINRDESGNRNIPNQQGPGGTPASTASGPAQFINSTWREMAPRAGVDVSRYPTAMSAGGPPGSPATPTQNAVTQQTLQARGLSPWASNPKVVQDVYGQMEQNGVNPPQIPPPPGGFDIATLAHAIEKTNPGIDDETFMAALDSASALMSRGTQQQWAQYKFATEERDKQADFKVREDEIKTQHDTMNKIAQGRLDQGQARVNQGQAKIDQANQKQAATQLPDDVAHMLAEQGASGDSSWKQNLGRGVQGAANIVKVQGMINQILKDRGQTGADLATKEAEFGGLKAGERTLSQRTANIGMRINEAQKFAPLALAASQNVDRSQFPSLNRLMEAGLQGIGDENVVRLGVATNSFLNAYAAAVTPTGTPTEGARGRAAEMLNMAWSNGQFETAIDQLMKEMSAAQTSPGAVREEFRKGTDPGQSANPGAGGQKKYTVGQIIDTPKGKMKVTGGDLSGDPDVEPVK